MLIVIAVLVKFSNKMMIVVIIIVRLIIIVIVVSIRILIKILTLIISPKIGEINQCPCHTVQTCSEIGTVLSTTYHYQTTITIIIIQTQI